MADLAFLHTAAVHVATFSALLDELAPSLRAVHLVRDDLLAEAQVLGTDDPALVTRVRAALTEADARVVVCTCSTLGGIAEATDTGGAFQVTRIDRAMADRAVRAGGTVLLVATVQSTLAPTAALLQSSAQRLGTSISIAPVLVAEAWPHFQAGRQAEYIERIVAAVRCAPRRPTVVLAQASMAPAAAVLATHGIEALTSPRLGVEHAIALCTAQ
ncbi:MAG TPA: Asp/Glu/hydantoin racemase [Rhizobacter sp.]|nr:Asp/Glu/hydantoin racemase [Rhizobacter sp.]